MSNKLPNELIDRILIYLPFEKVIKLRPRDNILLLKIYNENIHTYQRAIENKQLHIILWMYNNCMFNTLSYTFITDILKIEKYDRGLTTNLLSLYYYNNYKNIVQGIGCIEYTS